MAEGVGYGQLKDRVERALSKRLDSRAVVRARGSPGREDSPGSNLTDFACR